MSYEVHSILSKIPFMKVHHVTSWAVIEQWGFGNPIDEAKRRAADKMAHEAAREVLNKQEFQSSHEPDGLHLSVCSYFLTYNQMLELLTEVYSKGRINERANSCGVKL